MEVTIWLDEGVSIWDWWVKEEIEVEGSREWLIAIRQW